MNLDPTTELVERISALQRQRRGQLASITLQIPSWVDAAALRQHIAEAVPDVPLTLQIGSGPPRILSLEFER